jgi:hypothetical protein
MSEEKIEQIISLMNLLMEDMSVPRNIKKAVEEARRRLQEKGDPVVRAGGAIYSIGEVSEDINLPPHARTQIWHILSALETVKETEE